MMSEPPRLTEARGPAERTNVKELSFGSCRLTFGRVARQNVKSLATER
jgi:hypothetical protein